MEKRSRRLLLLGASGKLGTAVRRAFATGYEIVGVGRREIDAENLAAVTELVEAKRPDLVVNAIAMLGIDACEQDPERARRLNTLLPWRLAELSRDHGFVLAHASSDAVFGNAPGHFYVESDPLRPINVYGLTKAEGDAFVQSATPHGYVFRFPVLFGQSAREGQFVEKMLARVRAGERRLEIADDVVTTPSYACDVAAKMRWILESERRPGVYHVLNEGQASLYEIIRELVTRLGFDVQVVPVSHRLFGSVGRKNTHTTMRSERIAPLRPWREALWAYCETLEPTTKSVHTRKSAAPVILGVDLDNTLIRYDALFYELALEQGYVDSAVPRTKRAVRDAMRAKGLETQWTRLQAIAYGERLCEATPFAGALETIRELHARGIEMRIVSHKTRFPALGPRVDLRAEALQWLNERGLVDPVRTGIGEGQIYFEDDRKNKRARIRALGCTHFLDDLREFLLDPAFPETVTRFLFDPTGASSAAEGVVTVRHWDQLREHFPGKRRTRENHATLYSSP